MVWAWLSCLRPRQSKAECHEGSTLLPIITRRAQRGSSAQFSVQTCYVGEQARLVEETPTCKSDPGRHRIRDSELQPRARRPPVCLVLYALASDWLNIRTLSFLLCAELSDRKTRRGKVRVHWYTVTQSRQSSNFISRTFGS